MSPPASTSFYVQIFGSFFLLLFFLTTLFLKGRRAGLTGVTKTLPEFLFRPPRLILTARNVPPRQLELKTLWLEKICLENIQMEDLHIHTVAPEQKQRKNPKTERRVQTAGRWTSWFNSTNQSAASQAGEGRLSFYITLFKKLILFFK